MPCPDGMVRIEDKNIQRNLNMPRKLAVNLIKRGKHPNESCQRSCLTVCLIRPVFAILLKIDFRVDLRVFYILLFT